MEGEARSRHSRILDWLLVGVGFAMFAYHMISTQYLFLGAYEHQNLHLAFALVLLFLNGMYNAKTKWGLAPSPARFSELSGTIYVHLNMQHLEEVIGYPEKVDLLVGILLIVLVIEATRRHGASHCPSLQLCSSPTSFLATCSPASCTTVHSRSITSFPI